MNSMNAARLLMSCFCLVGLLLPEGVQAGHAGTVMASSGTISAVTSDGKSRVIQKGSPVSSGDTLVTAKGGRVDVRFSDESMVQLRPETRFRIDDYAYAHNPSGAVKGGEAEPRSFFSLIKGGFRAVSGMIAKIKRSNVAVVTPTATIGIRGTDYRASLDERAGLRVSVARGEISLENKAGSFSVAEGQGAYVPNADSVPTYTHDGDDRGKSGGRQAGAGKGGVQIKGNTRIEANTDRTNAIATGQENRAVNQAGVIGGD